MIRSRSLLVAATVVVALLVLVPERAEARRRGGGGFGGMPAQRTFGIGLILGAPTGLSGELRLGPNTALDFAIGIDSFDDDDGDDDGYLHVDYLVYLTDLSRGGSVGVPLYLGVGAVLWDHGRNFDDDLHVGLRVPFGIALALRRAPVQFFFELAVRVMLVDHDHGHDGVDLNGGLGFRVYF